MNARTDVSRVAPAREADVVAREVQTAVVRKVREVQRARIALDHLLWTLELHIATTTAKYTDTRMRECLRACIHSPSPSPQTHLELLLEVRHCEWLRFCVTVARFVTRTRCYNSLGLGAWH